MPNVLITPHVAIYGAPSHQKWEGILLENCRRFATGEPLFNMVDKAKWYGRKNGRPMLASISGHVDIVAVLSPARVSYT
jgi:hypothetical protein